MRRIVAALTAGLAFILLTGATTPPGAAAASFTSMTWNICGWKNVDQNGCPDGIGVTLRTDKVLKYIADNNVDVVLLQEICQKHVSVLQSKLGSGWTFHHVPYISRRGGADAVRWCANEVNGPNGSAGLAIGVREAGVPASAKEKHDLPRDATSGSWKHQLFCLNTAQHGKLCTMHLTWLNEMVDGKLVRAQQVKRVAEILGTAENVTVGGDFNNDPPDNTFPPDTDPQIVEAMVPMYELFSECDQVNFPGERAGSPTHNNGKKLDHIYSSTAFGACAVHPDPGGGAGDFVSDHRALIGS